MNYQPRRILVTGGLGFIGCHMIRLLLKMPFVTKVVNLDKQTYAANLDALDNYKKNDRYQLIHGDITNTLLVNKLLRDYRIDTVIHFAAESHVDRSIDKPADFISTNIVGTFNLLESCRRYWLEECQWTEQSCRFHHISTDEVYGSLGINDAPFIETTAYSPRSPYSASKASSDHLVQSYYHTYGLPITLSNCSNNYGPYQHTEKLIPKVIQCCFANQPIPIYGKGENIRDWLFVEDHCEHIAAILTQGIVGERYHIGGGNELSNTDLVNCICDYLNQYHPKANAYHNLITYTHDRQGHDYRYAIETTQSLVGFDKNYFSLNDKLPETIEWYWQLYAQQKIANKNEKLTAREHAEAI